MTEDSSTPEDSVDWSAMEDLATEDSDVLQPVIITDEMLAMRVLWDVVPCPLVTEVAEYMGLPASSEEVSEMDHLQSHGRAQQIATLGPYIETMSAHAAAAVVAGTVYVTHKETDQPLLDKEELTELTEKTFPMIYQSVVSVLSELVDVGLLHLPHYATFTTFSEGNVEE